MHTEQSSAPSRIQRAVILFSVLSLPVISQLLWMQAKAQYGDLVPRVAASAAAGVLLGLGYLVLLRKGLSKRPGLDGGSAWESLLFFHATLLGAWLYVLPLPAKYTEFTAAFLFTAGTAKILSFVYQEFGTSLSNRKRFATNFVILATTTMVVISVVKTSLALSLGLVGALSIVRFRTAIKDPEELAFLFFTIVLGLGFGAGQIVYTFVGFVGILLVFVWISRTRRNDSLRDNYIVSVTLSKLDTGEANRLTECIRSVAGRFEIKRLDVGEDGSEIIYLAELPGKDSPARVVETVRESFPQAIVSVSDSQGLA